MIGSWNAKCAAVLGIIASENEDVITSLHYLQFFFIKWSIKFPYNIPMYFYSVNSKFHISRKLAQHIYSAHNPQQLINDYPKKTRPSRAITGECSSNLCTCLLNEFMYVQFTHNRKLKSTESENVGAQLLQVIRRERNRILIILYAVYSTYPTCVFEFLFVK